MLPKIISIGLLLATLLIDIKYVQFIVNPDIQLILGTTIIAIIVFFDAWAGLILAIAVFILYLRVYSNKYGLNISEILTGRQSKNYPMESLVDAYITPKNLEDAQNNIVSDTAYNKEIKGIKGVYNEPVYGAQGIDTTMPGYGSPFPGESLK
jgi:hypothetical protein